MSEHPALPASASLLRPTQRLVVKLNLLLAVFFFFALILILLSLNVARQLEGGAAAINDAGSLRMRAFALGLFVFEARSGGQLREIATADAQRFVRDFEATLSRLEAGDPDRPLFLPREARIGQQMKIVREEWQTRIKPLVQTLMSQPPQIAAASLTLFGAGIKDFVQMVDELVLMIERSNAGRTDRLYLFQNILVAFSLIGTLLLAFLVHTLVTRPLSLIKSGITRMTAADFGVRLPVQSSDEFGELALEFNRMADRLQNLYATLEQRVEEKSRRMEEANRALAQRNQERAVMEERNLLAQELHDSIAQTLAFLNIQAQMLQTSLTQHRLEPALEDLARIREGIQECYDNVRELLAYFRIRVDHADLFAALRGALEKFELQTAIQCAYAQDVECAPPTQASVVQVLHIVEEALSNIRKHAQASRVWLTVKACDGLCIEVRDNGCGFNPITSGEGDGGVHVGLRIMTERARQAGARIDIESAPGQGCAVILRFAAHAGD